MCIRDSDNTGDIMGDVTKRRGRVLGMEPDEDGMQTVSADVPLAEPVSYTHLVLNALAHSLNDLLGRKGFTAEELFHQLIVGLGNGLSLIHI